MAITSYYYNKQINRYILQFANIFAGLSVRTGKGSDGQITELEVPIVYSSKDRVVASIASGHTENRLHTLPIMSCFLTGIELAPERRKGVNQTDRRSFMPQGGLFPDDASVIYRLMPVPYNFTFDLNIYVSNTDQAWQVVEQLAMLFDPTLELQTSDKPLDWTKISSIELTGLQTEENIPSGTEKRMIIWTLTFTVAAWISAPVDIKQNIIQKIILRYGDLDKFVLYEYNDEGEPEPFGENGLWSVDIIEAEAGLTIEEPKPEDKI